MFESKKLMIPTTTRGPIGELRPVWNSGKNLNMKKPMNKFAVMIAPFPRRWIKLPIPFVRKKDFAFFKARTKAAMADEQKFSPVKAIWM